MKKIVFIFLFFIFSILGTFEAFATATQKRALHCCDDAHSAIHAKAHAKTPSLKGLPEVENAAPALGRIAESHHLLPVSHLGGCFMNVELPTWIPPSSKKKIKITLHKQFRNYQMSILYSNRKYIRITGGEGAYGNEEENFQEQPLYLGEGITGFLASTPFPPYRFTLTWTHAGRTFITTSRSEGEVIQKSEAVLHKLLNYPLPPLALGSTFSLTPNHTISVDWWSNPGCGYSVSGNFPLDTMLHIINTTTPLGDTSIFKANLSGKIWYLAQENILWESKNQGRSWEASQTFSNAISGISSFPNGDAILGIEGGGIKYFNKKQQVWKNVPSPVMNLMKGPWRIEKTLYVLTNPPSNIPGHGFLLVKSKDQGKTWNPAVFLPQFFKSSSGSVSWPFHLLFPRPNLWLAVTSTGGDCSLPDQLFISLNHGQTWNPLTLIGIKEPFKITTIAEISHKKWLIGGQRCFGMAGPILYYTKDGGYHVKPIHLPFDLKNPGIKKILFLNSDLGIAVGSQNAGFGAGMDLGEDLILKTINGGKNWINISRSGYPGISTIFCSRKKFCTAVTPDPKRAFLTFQAADTK